MADTRQRLISSFQVIFPGLTEAQIQEASPDSVSTWDSVATVTLVNVIEEEFGLEIALDDVRHVLSFTLMLDYVRSRES